ncbi:hypothetical protein MSMAT_1973 [Methanosarcina mazei TMA]|jgi:hypothetical protein|uniref:hypothetical protein n=2 Tax=Methanosarcina mazei TaxID=2209 RepID=UPI0006D473EF|nr:hypothetical protein [Methanosarcina mazei]UWJ23230.1 hypothetical protein MSMAT_1973 [Methanosarcina mazei TMA]BBL65712.1 hypothetical protein MmazTMA_26890 [Methanosarcina mazei]
MFTMSKGDKLEILVEEHFRWLFEEMDFQVTKVRRQESGAQFGFDVKVQFYDDDDHPRNFFFECKDYSTELNFNAILRKMFELDSSSYKADAFIAISPKTQISNIKDNTLESCREKFPFSIDLWDTTSNIEELFALNSDFFYELYNYNYSNPIDRNNVINITKLRINDLIKQKNCRDLGNRIKIIDSDREPNENENYKTTLDCKLNSIFPEHDETRLRYHKFRCNYKIYLEDLEDTNNDLRSEILDWQENLKIKAYRLTGKFNVYPDDSPRKFFYDFFDEAKTDLDILFKNGNYTGDIEKLLNGIVMELAAECPLDWRKNEPRYRVIN